MQTTDNISCSSNKYLDLTGRKDYWQQATGHCSRGIEWKTLYLFSYLQKKSLKPSRKTATINTIKKVGGHQPWRFEVCIQLYALTIRAGVKSKVYTITAVDCTTPCAQFWSWNLHKPYAIRNYHLADHEALSAYVVCFNLISRKFIKYLSVFENNPHVQKHLHQDIFAASMASFLICNSGCFSMFVVRCPDSFTKF